MLLLVALLGCQPGASDASAVPAPAPLTADAAPAFDPLRGPLAWSVTGEAGAEVTVAVERDGAELWSTTGTLDAAGTLSGAWDASSDPPAAGVVELVVTDGSRTATDPSAVVRTGLSAAAWTDDGGTDSHRELLFWRGSYQLQDADAPVSLAGEGEDFPVVSDDLVWQPTDGTAEPVAYRFDSRPRLVLTVPTESSLGGTGLDAAEVEVSLEGWSPVGTARITPGATVTLERDTPLADTVGLTEETLLLRFEAPDGEQRWELGSQDLPVRIYRTLGPQTTGYDVDAAQPWVAAIDPALRAIDGAWGEHDAVVDALVEWIYNDLGLVYDTAAGASFYSEYVWFDWERPHFFLTDFLQRRNGSVVNCTDSGNILATHANMLGAELVHIVILENYSLNEIKAVGISQFTSCPFGPFSCGFSYHAVTTNTSTADTIWDTTLALDGDADPGASPSVELLVQSITGEEYLQRLVRSGSAAYDHPARVSFE